MTLKIRNWFLFGLVRFEEGGWLCLWLLGCLRWLGCLGWGVDVVGPLGRRRWCLWVWIGGGVVV